MSLPTPIDPDILVRSEKRIELLEQQARNLARSVEAVRQQTLAQSNERIEALEQKARDLARFVETTRQQALSQADKKTEALEQKACDLADFVETLRNQTRLQSEAEIKALGQQARDLALFVETVRKETRLQSEAEIAALGQKARDLAVCVESVREETLRQSDTEIAALGQQARDLAVSVESVREETLLQSESEIAALGQRARDLAVSVESTREKTLLKSRETDKVTRQLNEKLEQHVRDRTAELQVANRSLADFMAALDEHAIVAITDGRGKITYVNDKFCAISRYSREELLGQDHRIINSGHHPIAFIRELWQTIAKGRVWHGEIKNLAKDGTFYWVDTTIVPLLGANGKPSQHIAIRADITERKVTEKQIIDLNTELRQRADQLAEANKELEAFSYSVSHDLRAPLRAIDGFSRILLEDFAGPLPEQANAYLQLVRDNTRQMGHLVDDLLAFSRLGRQSLTKQTVDTGKVVSRCLAELQSEQKGRQLEILIEDLPSCQADPTLLKQVWTNLLSNALKYTRKQQLARIAIGCRTQPRPLTNGQPTATSQVVTESVYFVKDNGAGFDVKYANKLFGVFQRLHRAADYEGTGVGLAIVQRIVNRHGGRVWGDAQLNQGATFSFTLE
jgi:PAS domain S-box-containing protein